VRGEMEGEKHGRVQEVDSPQAYAQAYVTASASGKLLVVDYSASWCGPCHHIAPVYAELSQRPEFHDVVFLKVDVDEQKELAAAAGVTGLPTFHLFKDGTKVDTITGANPTKLEASIKKHALTASTVDEAFALPSGHMVIDEYIDKAHAICLNQQNEHSWENILSSDLNKYLESDCDEQLLIYIPFRQVVKIHSLCFTAPDDGRGPKSVKVFVNNPHMDFGSVDSTVPTQEFDLSPKELMGDTLTPLKFVKFQNVTAVTVFVENSQGEKETSVISRLQFVGHPLDTSDMKQFKRVVGEKNEVHG